MSKKLSILIVDDEPRIRLALEYNLQQDGYEVYTAENGLEGLEKAAEKKPGLILLDWMMPVLDGMEVLRNLKRDKETADIPVFMMTAKSCLGDIDEALAMGADDYITKPFDVWGLSDMLTEKLEKIGIGAA